jgi:integrase
MTHAFRMINRWFLVSDVTDSLHQYSDNTISDRLFTSYRIDKVVNPQPVEYVSSVAAFHRATKVANPCGTQTVKLALRRMRRATGRAQQQAAPGTMARRSELVALPREDLQVEADGFGTIVIRRRKTDQEGQGAVAPVTQDAMRHLLAWTAVAGVGEGLLFRAALKGGRVGGAMNAGEVARTFKSMARAAVLSVTDTARISGHSTRVGAAQDMLRHGEQLPEIMQAGRWKTAEMVSRYTARQGARESAAVRIANRRVRF